MTRTTCPHCGHPATDAKPPSGLCRVGCNCIAWHGPPPPRPTVGDFRIVNDLGSCDLECPVHRCWWAARTWEDPRLSTILAQAQTHLDEAHPT
jgi:hypothetical protein